MSWLARVDIRQAFEHAAAGITLPDQPDFSMLVDPDLFRSADRDRVLMAGGEKYVIPAMPARAEYLKMIRPKRGDQP